MQFEQDDMNDKDTKRLSRLTAILTLLQTKRLLTASDLAKKFNLSIRTIYRDIKALENAGVPIVVVEGKGYALMEGYRIPPVMFTEREANALITAEQLIQTNRDSSFVSDYSDAINKIRSVLHYATKDKAELLSKRIAFRLNPEKDRTSDYLSTLQLAITNFNLIRISYFAPDKNETTERSIEPFAIYSAQENWILIAWCRLRTEYRSFRLDRILKLQITNEYFSPHTISLQDYFEQCRAKYLSSP